VARALKLADKEELEIKKPAEAVPEPTPLVVVPTEESDVQVIEAPLVKKRRLKKGAEPTIPATKPAAPVVEPFVPAVKTTGVAGFLAARRHQAPPPSVLKVEDVAAFLANEPVLAIPVNVIGQVEEPLRAPE
jgi:hypothetical protein